MPDWNLRRFEAWLSSGLLVICLELFLQQGLVVWWGILSCWYHFYLVQAAVVEETGPNPRPHTTQWIHCQCPRARYRDNQRGSLSISFRTEFKILVLTYKVIHGQAPSYLKDLIAPCRSSRTLHSLNAGLLVITRISKTRKGGSACTYQAPLLWNHFPVLVREANTVSDFKSKLKTFLLDKDYS